MTQQGLDFSDVQNYDKDDFEPLPAGTYMATILSAENTHTKADINVKMFKLKLEILSGEYQGRKIFDNVIYVHPGSQQSMAIGRKKMRQYAEAVCGGPAFNELTALNKPLTLKLSIQNSDRGIQNNVQKVSGAAGFGQPTSQAPTQNTQMGTGIDGIKF